MASPGKFNLRTFNTLAPVVKAVVILAVTGVVAGAFLLTLSLRERSARSSADISGITASQAADASIRASIGGEIAARLAGDAAASKAASDYADAAVARESTTLRATLAEEAATRQRTVADEVSARRRDIADEAAARLRGIADEAGARQQGIDAAINSAKNYTNDAIASDAAAQQAALQAAISAASSSGQQSATAASTTAKQYTDTAVAAETAGRVSAVSGLTTSLNAEGTARIAADAATLTSAQLYANAKIAALQTYTLSSLNIDVPAADSPNFFNWTNVCNAGDIAISGGITYDPSLLKTGAADAQTKAGVVRSQPDATDASHRTWGWSLRNTGGTKVATFTVLCLKLTP